MSIRKKNLREAAQAACATAREIAEKAQAENRNFTTDEKAAYDEAMQRARDLTDQLKAVTADEEVLANARALADEVGPAIKDGDLIAAAKSGHLGLTGRRAKSLARNIADNALRPVTITGPDGLRAKSVIASGSHSTSMPMADTIGEMGKPPQSLLDVLIAQTVASPAYSYLRQTTRTNNAATVAEGATKPTSVYTLTSTDARLRVIAHLSEQVPSYTLSDNAAVQRFVEDELLFGLRTAVEAQVVNGDGSGENLTGICGTSGIQSQAFATDILTSVRKGITKLEATGYTPGVLAVSAGDWEALELLTATSGATDVRGVPVDAVARRLWGVQTVVCGSLPAKTALMLDLSAVTVDSDGVIDTRWSDAVSDDFQKNYVRARTEGRFGLSVYKPMGVVKIATASA
ncbi:phage major capsid protein [Jongsikchunia kroppenstedtii]|uniref:phage major capsid protein n=1 Tax=Jongsikchunia kroppenstedtii TaxID=1121721 RepID=UPI000368DA09|nr:phage major capsid protein [Jongsikchunia kroppenstedtii]